MKLYQVRNNFHGGWNTLSDPRDIEVNELSKAQNVSIDKKGRTRTAGSFVSHSEVPTNTGVVCPGSGLDVYSSDHWKEGSPSVVDLGPLNSAVSDRTTEADSTGTWAAGSPLTNASVADTDGGAIASNGTSYIFKLTSGGSGTESLAALSIPVNKGRPFKLSADLYCRTATSIYLQVMDDGDIETLATSVIYSTAGWSEVSIDFVSSYLYSAINIYIRIVASGAGEIAYADDVYLTEMPDSDIRGDWLALSDAPNAQVDLYSDNDDAFSAGSLDFGTVSTYNSGGTADIINFPTTSTITDSTSQFLNKGMQPGQIWKISGCTSQAANNILVVLIRVTAGTLFVRGTPLTVQADEDGTVVFTKYNPTAFHFVDEALRASPVGGGIALRPKHYSFVNRIHFGKALAGGDEYNNWFLNDVGPAAPTDQYVEITDSDGDRDITGDLTAGAGFEIAVTSNASAGDWIAGTWEVATTFIDDDWQESTLYAPSTAQTFTTVDGDSLDVAVRAHNTGGSYDERISGGRAYCRKTLSDDSWILLVDIDMKQGARATLGGEYNAWAEGATTHVVYSDGFDSFKMNPDTFENLTGLDPSATIESFSSDNRYWGASVIAGTRCFLFSPRYTDSAGNTIRFADRILYSEAGKYDIFPINNFIDVVRGDADDYVAGAFWGGKLLAFKGRHLHVIDISDPNPVGWSIVEGSPYKFRGVVHPGAVFETPHGIVWCNKFGAWLYNGEVISLIKNRIDPTDWASFWTDYTMTGYHADTNQLIFLRDATGQGGSAQNETMFYDFDLDAWTEGNGIFDTSKVYTNFVTDWNQDLIIGVQTNSTTVTIQKWDPTPAAVTVANGIIIRFNDEDYENPAILKEITGIGVTYKSSAAQTAPLRYYKDGATSGPTSLTGNFSAVSVWTKLIITPTAFKCNSIRLECINPTNTGTIEINDVVIRRREIPDNMS